MTVKIEDLKAIKILENGISLMEDSKKDNPEMIVFLENEVNLYHKAIEELCDIFKEFEDRGRNYHNDVLGNIFNT